MAQSVLRREIDRETLLGAVAAYLLTGMFFAFAYKAAGELGSVPFSVRQDTAASRAMYSRYGQARP